MMFRIWREIAKKRIKRLEYLTYVKSGKELPAEYEKAQVLRKKYGLEDWSYEVDY